MIDREKVIKGLECCCQMNGNVCRTECPYSDECIENECVGTAHLCANALELLKKQNEIIDALLKVGYPHNFQREPPWIVNYMLNITDVIKKAVHLRNEEVKQDD